MIRRAIWLAAIGFGSVVAFGAAREIEAQPFPTRAIRIIVPATPGGGTDILARTVAQKLSAAWGQQVVVDNRAGGGGMIGSEMVAKAAPDGYTLLMAYMAHVTNPSLYAKMPYDTVNDFAPISLVAVVSSVLAVHPSLPVKSTAELIALAKAHPAELAYSSAGNGSASHLSTALFCSLAGLKMVHVPYRGMAPALNDLIAGHVALTIGVITPTLPHVRSGRLRGLAVTSTQRSEIAPELPTIAEAALPGYSASAWFGMLAPARTPDAVINRLNAEIVRVLQLADVKERLAAQGADLPNAKDQIPN